MTRNYLTLLMVLLLVGCDQPTQNPAAGPPGAPSGSGVSLAQARQGFKTSLVRRGSDHEPVAVPPQDVFRIVKYDSPVGKLPAYLTLDPKDGKQHPAIIWITGGDCNSIGDVWSAAPAENDQTAAAYRQAGIVMMFPSLRGGNTNAGQKEGFLGEVNDVIAAAEFLASQPFVDPNRIYLGGHSTGGTLALLVAECDDRFRAIFSFGPVADVSGYGPEYCPFNLNDPEEVQLRSPMDWLAGVQDPTFVIEGTARGNIDSLRTMKQMSKNSNVHFVEVRGGTHFDILAPLNKLIAQKILKDTGDKCNLRLTEEEMKRAVAP
jgi:dipeptidyl aminopeptidase/acylaminoacyl peptidase